MLAHNALETMGTFLSAYPCEMTHEDCVGIIQIFPSSNPTYMRKYLSYCCSKNGYSYILHGDNDSL